MTSSPTTLDEIYRHIITVNLGQSAPADVTLGVLLLALGNALQAGTSGQVVGVSFPFTFNTPNIVVTGVPIGFTPEVGDILLEAAVNIQTAFNGTTPQGYVGPSGGPILNDFDATHADSNLGNGWFSSGNSVGIGGGTSQRCTTPAPILVWIDDGSGGDPGSTQGAAIVTFTVLRLA